MGPFQSWCDTVTALVGDDTGDRYLFSIAFIFLIIQTRLQASRQVVFVWRKRKRYKAQTLVYYL